MLAEGVIEPSQSPWCSWPLLHRKPSGSYRFCVGYRKVNEVTKHDAVPMQHQEDLLDSVQGSLYISKLDLSQAYLHIGLEAASKEITAFAVLGRGLFQFKRMAYGLRNGPATFQRLTDAIIPPDWSSNVRKYVDDFIIFTRTIEDHVVWVERVIRRLTENNLTINPDKSEFLCDEVAFLGYKINRSGLFPNTDRIAPLLEYPAPRNVKEVQRFLGAVGWYARFLPSLAEDKIPLLELVKKDAKWIWGPAQQAAFDRLKKSLTEAPVLARPDFSRPFTLQTDASEYALGAVLTQPGEEGSDREHRNEKLGYERPICYASRVLTPAERNYSVTEKECLAVLWATEKFRPYIEGSQFTVITDHSSLRWLKTLRNPSGRLARWALALQVYNMEIVHRKGTLHVVPDALSRMYGDELGALEEVASTEDIWYKTRKDNVHEHPERYPDWKLVDDQLYRLKPNPQIDPTLPDLNRWKLVLPPDSRIRAIDNAHSLPQSGHYGIDKTYHRLAQDFYWPGIYQDVARYVRSCSECQQYKPSQKGPCDFMRERTVEGPWSIVAADIMGPFPRSTLGKKYLLVLQDYFTKYVELRA